MHFVLRLRLTICIVNRVLVCHTSRCDILCVKKKNMPRLFVALVAQLILPDVPAVAVKKATPTGGAQRKMISLRNEAARNNAQREKQNAVTARKNARQEKMRNLRKNLMEAYREKKGHPLASEEEQGAAAKEKQIKILSVRSKAKDDLLKLNHASSEEEQRIL